jgi:hypothetical protein
MKNSVSLFPELLFLPEFNNMNGALFLFLFVKNAIFIFPKIKKSLQTKKNKT